MTASPDETLRATAETKVLPAERIEEFREATRYGAHLGIGGKLLASILDSHESLRRDYLRLSAEADGKGPLAELEAMLDRAIAKLKAAPPQAAMPTREQAAWIIEREGAPGTYWRGRNGRPITYWTGTHPAENEDAWTEDSNNAIRFAGPSSATVMVMSRAFASSREVRLKCHAREHIWVDALFPTPTRQEPT